jgi:hypothetical protein
LSANEAKPTFALPNPNVGKLVHLRNQIGIAADFAIEGIVQLSGRITANPGSSPKIGLCPDCPQLARGLNRSAIIAGKLSEV